MTEATAGAAAPERDTGGPGPLAGVRVVELGMLLAGPFTGRLLGDMGAEVIKVEPPGQPDPLREWGKARYEGRSLWWPVQSRNKKCVTLNLRSERGQALLRSMVEHCDVLTENFRPGTLERWNLAPEQLWESNPGLVIARISGYGQSGPYAPRAGFASVAEAMGGIRYINGFPDEPPPRMHISLGDSLAGMYAAQAILAALYKRDALGFGKGQVIDVSLMEASFSLLESAVPEYDRLGIVRGPGGTGLKGVAPSNIFKSSDDKWIVIAANADGVFRRLCEAMGRPELADDERFSTLARRTDNIGELYEIVIERMGQRTTTEWRERLDQFDVPNGVVTGLEGLLTDPYLAATEFFERVEHPTEGKMLTTAVPVMFSGSPGDNFRLPPPRLGEHTREVLSELGYSDAEMGEISA